ncbi:DUF503 domain-containing protein [bacterium]|nr:DUF503 domain-containing protein [bacterium]
METAAPELYPAHLGVLIVDLCLSQAQSLKDKRRIIKPLLQRGIRGYQLSASELNYQSKIQRTLLGFALISGKISYIQSCLEEFKREIQSEYEENILSISLNII